MSDFLNGETTVATKISEINPYLGLVEYIRHMTDTELADIKAKGLIEDVSDELVRRALQYFLTVLDAYPDFSALGYRNAYNLFYDSSYLDISKMAREIEVINEGVIRGLYGTTSFNNMLELEYATRTVEITKKTIFLLEDDPENKEVLASVRSLNAISKEKAEALQDNKVIVVVPIPSKQFLASYEMLLNTCESLLDDVKQVNLAKYDKTVKEVLKDDYFRDERVGFVYNLSNLQN